MKSINYLLYFIISTVILTSSCQKKNTAVIITLATNSDTIVILGEEKAGVNITVFDSAIWVYYPLDEDYTDYHELDIDGDDIADFKFRSERYRGGSGFDYSYAGVYILHPDIEFSFMEKQDTLRRCQYYVTSNFGDRLYDVHYNYYSAYSCTNSIWDTIYPPQSLIIPTIHQYSDTLMDENYTYHEYFSFAYNNISISDASEPTFIYKIYHGFWNNLDPNYLVFRKKNGNEYKTGWVKLSVENNAKILLHEFAYQID